jgi:hypothetical protein
MYYQLFMSSGPMDQIIEHKTYRFETFEQACEMLNGISPNDHEISFKYTLVMADHGLSEKPIFYVIDFADVRCLRRPSDIIKSQMFHDLDRSRVASASLKNEYGVNL